MQSLVRTFLLTFQQNTFSRFYESARRQVPSNSNPSSIVASSQSDEQEQPNKVEEACDQRDNSEQLIEFENFGQNLELDPHQDSNLPRAKEESWSELSIFKKRESKALDKQATAINSFRVKEQWQRIKDLDQYEASQDFIVALEERKSQIRDKIKTMKQSTRSLNLDEFNCPICYDYLVACKITKCGHQFCHNCIQEALIRSKQCPQCRQDIRQFTLNNNPAIQNLIYQSLEQRENKEDFTRYQSRVQAYQDWVDKHSLKEVKAGDTIDARDTEYIWCKAKVEVILKSQGRAPLLFIHYEGWNKKYDEYLYQTSHRLSPLGTYTERVDIPRYDLNSNRNVMFSTVVERADQLRQRPELNLDPFADEDEIRVDDVGNEGQNQDQEQEPLVHQENEQRNMEGEDRGQANQSVHLEAPNLRVRPRVGRPVGRAGESPSSNAAAERRYRLSSLDDMPQQLMRMIQQPLNGRSQRIHINISRRPVRQSSPNPRSQQPQIDSPHPDHSHDDQHPDEL